MMRITSDFYRGHEIVHMPNGKHLIHKGDCHGPLIDRADSENEAKSQIDRIIQVAREAQD